MLEVGCGVGLKLLRLARQRFSCTGIDCAEERVKRAGRRNPGVGGCRHGDFVP
ncbi:methyltransferase domain-containing protein [Streptomyces sp. NPDC094438]|uniref:methyltransferase domain-containing protein n=1 Tax=Streptomyces sp. NPDC094438 TaxID=3366061 RepID=UPI00382DA992